MMMSMALSVKNESDLPWNWKNGLDEGIFRQKVKLLR